MKKTSFLAILLAALVLAAGVVTKDSELVKSYVPVLLEQLQAMDTAVPKEMPPKAEAKTQEAVKTADDILAVTALDIGQGDSILVQMQGKNILIDSGDRSEAARLLTKLEENHVEQIDMLIATHPHADHIGGMKAVLNRFMTAVRTIKLKCIMTFVCRLKRNRFLLKCCAAVRKFRSMKW